MLSSHNAILYMYRINSPGLSTFPFLFDFLSKKKVEMNHHFNSFSIIELIHSFQSCETIASNKFLNMFLCNRPISLIFPCKQMVCTTFTRGKGQGVEVQLVRTSVGTHPDQVIEMVMVTATQQQTRAIWCLVNTHNTRARRHQDTLLNSVNTGAVSLYTTRGQPCTLPPLHFSSLLYLLLCEYRELIVIFNEFHVEYSIEISVLWSSL